MTREEAVIILDGFKNNPLFNSTHARAFDMAISALSENKGDLISRQAVLDELEKWDWQELYLPIHFKQILDDVPSVENKGEMRLSVNDLNVLKSMLSGIKIERNMLIRRTNKTEEDKNDLEIDELQIKALKSAISALSENKGRWIDNGTCTYMCSNCKTEWTTSQIEKMCFCPTCGADMRGKENDK